MVPRMLVNDGAMRKLLFLFSVLLVQAMITHAYMDEGKSGLLIRTRLIIVMLCLCFTMSTV